MVGTDPLEVDRLLTCGELRCPDCTGELRPWGHARERGLRDVATVVTLRPRRSLCSQCRSTHVLLPASTLVRRADTVVVIGQALLAKAGGSGHRSIAALLKRPVSTVRGWLRRFGVRAESLRVLFTGLLHELNACAAAVPVTGSVFADALEVLGLAAAAASPSTSRASAKTDPVTGTAAAQALSSWSSPVNSTRRLSARTPNRRSQPRTVLTGRFSSAAMLRWPEPPALASSAWPITTTVSALRTSVEAGRSTCVDRHCEHNERRGRRVTTVATSRSPRSRA